MVYFLIYVFVIIRIWQFKTFFNNFLKHWNLQAFKNLHSRLYIWNYNPFKIDHCRIYKYSLGQCHIFFSSFDEKNSNQTWLWIKSMTQHPRLYCSDLYSELSFQNLYRHNTYSVISSSDLLYLSRIKSTLSKGVWLVPQTLKKMLHTNSVSASKMTVVTCIINFKV